MAPRLIRICRIQWWFSLFHLHVFSKKSILHFDVTWLISQQFTCRDFQWLFLCYFGEGGVGLRSRCPKHFQINIPGKHLRCNAFFIKFKTTILRGCYPENFQNIFFMKRLQGDTYRCIKQCEIRVNNCVKSVYTWSFPGSYSVEMQKNTDQKTPNADSFHAVNNSRKKEQILISSLWKSRWFQKWTGTVLSLRNRKSLSFHSHSVAYLEPCQRSKMERFAKIVNGSRSEYVSEITISQIVSHYFAAQIVINRFQKTWKSSFPDQNNKTHWRQFLRRLAMPQKYFWGKHHLWWSYFTKIVKGRSNHQKCSIERGVIKNFAKFTWKPLCLKPVQGY